MRGIMGMLHTRSTDIRLKQILHRTSMHAALSILFSYFCYSFIMNNVLYCALYLAANKNKEKSHCDLKVQYLVYLQ